MAGLNQFRPSLKSTYETSKEKVTFLDVSVSINNGKIFTDLLTKSTDCHLYFHCNSSHPEHKKSITHSRILRLVKISSYEKDFNIHS